MFRKGYISELKESSARVTFPDLNIILYLGG